MGYSSEGRHSSRSRRLIWLGVLTLTGLVWAAMIVAGGPDADAYESYHDPNTNDLAYCSSCHDEFAGGRNAPLHRLHVSGTSALGVITRNCNLCHVGSGRDNPMTMWSKGDANDGLGCAGCHGRDYGETIHADYQGRSIAGLPKATTYGLRDRHARSEISCFRCHNRAPAGVKAENIAPPYYSRTDVNVSDPCADLLDNDGDGDYDSDDSDCSGNAPPVADPNGPYEGTVGVAVEFDGSASFDLDGSIVAYDWAFGDGTTGAGATPSHAYAATGAKTVTLTVTDDGGLTDTATTTATITLTPNTPPVAADESYSTSEGVVLSVAAPGVLGNDLDADGDPLLAVLDGDVSHGTLTLESDGSFTYTPAVDHVGSDSFTYVADDGIEHSNPATVTITVNLVGVVLAIDDSYTTFVDKTLTVTAPGVFGNDVGGASRWAFKRSDPTGGSVVLLPDGSFTYVPDAGFVGSDSFTYDFWDEDNLKWSNTATVNIEVARVDLDIDHFRATRKVDLSRFRGITLTLQVVNNGTVPIPDAGFGATATIVGVQDPVEVYRTTLPVWKAVSENTTEFEIEIGDPDLFSPGQVLWTVTLDVPNDADFDEATAATTIVD